MKFKRVLVANVQRENSGNDNLLANKILSRCERKETEHVNFFLIKTKSKNFKMTKLCVFMA